MASRSCDSSAFPQRGVYVLVVHLARGCRVRVGRLGRRFFGPGWYCYAGSAQRGLLARLRRHARRRKVRHWHIDSLTAVGSVVGAWVGESAKSAECRLAAALSVRGEVTVGFGASDCRCRGHLVRFRTKREVDAAVRACWGRAVSGRACDVCEPLWWAAGGQRAKNSGKKG